MELIRRIVIMMAALAAALGLAGCVNTAGIDPVEDRANHEAYLESIYTEHDPEYVDDCLAYLELVCEFE
jgi:hypothetical protein